jgi:hypothetical protein
MDFSDFFGRCACGALVLVGECCPNCSAMTPPKPPQSTQVSRVDPGEERYHTHPDSFPPQLPGKIGTTAVTSTTTTTTTTLPPYLGFGMMGTTK